ncbi:glycoside hydrolase superfamily [Blastocladiella britannica]|nr:glycoside hydrolase superfamily [Blastocladiella britannica]
MTDPLHPAELRKRQSAHLVDDPTATSPPLRTLDPPPGLYSSHPPSSLADPDPAAAIHATWTTVSSQDTAVYGMDSPPSPANGTGNGGNDGNGGNGSMKRPSPPPPPLYAPPLPSRSRTATGDSDSCPDTTSMAMDPEDDPVGPPNQHPSLAGRWFVDRDGRRLLLRGVNLSGNCKLPMVPLLPSHVGADFFRDLEVSFVGRPFALADADAHFALLRSWGFSVVRFLVTWEAVEHFGPGLYDDEYVEYVVQVLKAAERNHIACVLDPHQDVWSRFAGGSGAPGWTMRLVGLDARALHDSGAAFVHAAWCEREARAPDQYPKMIWQTNYYKLAAATMFTLFFGGRAFAPRLTVADYPRGDKAAEGVRRDGAPSSAAQTQSGTRQYSVEDFLQWHFIHAMAYLHSRVVAAGLTAIPPTNDAPLLPTVLGWDTFNEPNPGWIGCPDLSAFLPWQTLRNGPTPTPAEALLAGSGRFVQGVANYSIAWCGPVPSGSTSLNDRGVSAWLETRPSPLDLHVAGLAAAQVMGTRVHVQRLPLSAGCDPVTPPPAYTHFPAGGCIWAAHGVYDPMAPTPDQCALRPDYFHRDPAHGWIVSPEAFTNTYWMRFAMRFTRALRAIDRCTIMFLDPPVNEEPPHVREGMRRRAEDRRRSAGAVSAAALTAPSPSALFGTRANGGGTRKSTAATIDLSDKPSVPSSVAGSAAGLVPASTQVMRSLPPHVHLAVPESMTVPPADVDPAQIRDLVYAPHWYDGLTLITKHVWPYNVDFLHIQRGKRNWITGLRLGARSVRRGMVDSLALVRDEAREHLGDVPVLMGEIGIPFDMDPPTTTVPSAKARRALDGNLAALDLNALHATLWTYVPENQRGLGDLWNGEDLSVVHAGAPRPARTLLRPVPLATAGEPLVVGFDVDRRIFDLVVRRSERVCASCRSSSITSVDLPPCVPDTAPPIPAGVDPSAIVPRAHTTEVYLPWLHYGGAHSPGLVTAVSSGTVAVDFARQRLFWVHGLSRAWWAGHESEASAMAAEKRARASCETCGAECGAHALALVTKVVRLQVSVGENDVLEVDEGAWQVPQGVHDVAAWCSWREGRARPEADRWVDTEAVPAADEDQGWCAWAAKAVGLV